MTALVVKVWDGDRNLRGSIDPAAVATPQGLMDARTATLSLDDLVARWLYDEEARDAWLTIDGPDGRWEGRLKEWEIRRVGTCEHCAHCMAKQMTVKWVNA